MNCDVRHTVYNRINLSTCIYFNLYRNLNFKEIN